MAVDKDELSRPTENQVPLSDSLRLIPFPCDGGGCVCGARRLL